MKRYLVGVVSLLGVMACDRGLSPGESVDALFEAISQRDSLAIEQYIDVEQLATTAVEPLLAAARAMVEADPDALGPGMTGRSGDRLVRITSSACGIRTRRRCRARRS